MYVPTIKLMLMQRKRKPKEREKGGKRGRERVNIASSYISVDYSTLDIIIDCMLVWLVLVRFYDASNSIVNSYH